MTYDYLNKKKDGVKMNNKKNNEKKDGKIPKILTNDKFIKDVDKYLKNIKSLNLSNTILSNTILIGTTDPVERIEDLLKEHIDIPLNILISLGGVFPEDDYEYIHKIISAYRNIKKTTLNENNIRVLFIMPFKVEGEHYEYAEELIKEILKDDIFSSNDIVVKIEPYNDENMKSSIANKKISEIKVDIIKEVYPQCDDENSNENMIYINDDKKTPVGGVGNLNDTKVTIEEEETIEIDLLGDRDSMIL